MRIVTLIENTTCREDLACEHGLSLYIETGKYKILFDFGQSEAFSVNAQGMGIDLKALDFAILSHGHYDHGGGIEKFLSINQTAPVYLRSEAFGGHYNASGKYIGLAPMLRESNRLIHVYDDLELAPGIHLRSANSRETIVPVDPSGLTLRSGDQFFPETFPHEQYLLIEEKGRRICVSGCSHKGILNIMHWFQPDVFVGGFHFMKLDANAPALEDAANILMEYPTQYYTGHCTGQEQFAKLKSIMGHQLHEIETGIEFNI